jgi:hypothetical protein
MPPTFNVLLATIARSSLQRMLDSLKPQLHAEDCLTLVFDGRTKPGWVNLEGFACKIVIHEEPVALGYWGHGIRNKYTTLLEKRDFVMHGDDDDIYTSGTFDYLRENCCNNDCLYIGKMRLLGGSIVPIIDNNPIRICNIGTPNGIIPYELNKLGTWQTFHGGDGRFYEQIARIAHSITYLDFIIYVVRP